MSTKSLHDNAGESEANAATASANTGPNGGTASDNLFTFHDMRLRVGDRIQLQPPTSVSTDRYFVRLIGYVDNISLLVTAPLANGIRVPIRENDKIVARVFSSQKAFGFDCTVLRTCKLPYDYLHLSFPDVVQGALVRKSPRIRIRIITSVAKANAAAGKEKLSGIIVDLSIDGALIKARQALGEKSEELLLSFQITLHEVDAVLTTRAVIRNVFTDDEGDSNDPLKFRHGVQFLDLSANDRVILQSLIYQQIIEHPQSLT